MDKSPCYCCEDRSMRCHTHCADYQSWKASNKEFTSCRREEFTEAGSDGPLCTEPSGKAKHLHGAGLSQLGGQPGGDPVCCFRPAVDAFTL